MQFASIRKRKLQKQKKKAAQPEPDSLIAIEFYRFLFCSSVLLRSRSSYSFF